MCHRLGPQTPGVAARTRKEAVNGKARIARCACCRWAPRRHTGGGVWRGKRLPTEAQLATRYVGCRGPPCARLSGNSRQFRSSAPSTALARSSPKALAVTAGLERLDSITESIRNTGREPGMIYKGRVLRPLMPDEAEKLQVSGDAHALELRRTILVDGEVVAYSYDLMPVGVFPAGEVSGIGRCAHSLPTCASSGICTRITRLLRCTRCSPSALAGTRLPGVRRSMCSWTRCTLTVLIGHFCTRAPTFSRGATRSRSAVRASLLVRASFWWDPVDVTSALPLA